jgi:hypothetical protein
LCAIFILGTRYCARGGKRYAHELALSNEKPTRADFQQMKTFVFFSTL